MGSQHDAWAKLHEMDPAYDLQGQTFTVPEIGDTFLMNGDERIVEGVEHQGGIGDRDVRLLLDGRERLQLSEYVVRKHAGVIE